MGRILFADFVVDEDTLTLKRLNGADLRARPHQVLVLIHLVNNSDRWLEAEELYKAGWGERYNLEAGGNVKQAISRLRSCLGDHPRSGKFIRTTRGPKYRWVFGGIPQRALRDKRLSLAAQAAAAGGEIIRRRYGEDAAKLNYTGSMRSAMSTVIDRHAQKAIIRTIRSQDKSPRIRIMAEEGTQQKAWVNFKNEPGRRLWLVDPLDGTAAFLYRADPSLPSVLIACLEGDAVVCAVMYFPLTGEWWWALKGDPEKGEKDRAFFGNRELNTAAKPGLKLQDAWVNLNQYVELENDTPLFIRARDALRGPAGAGRVTWLMPYSGVATKILNENLAAVIHDNNPKEFKQCPWDVAAVQFIVEAAGGAVVNLTGERYNFFRPEPFIVASSRDIAQQIVNLCLVPAHPSFR